MKLKRKVNKNASMQPIMRSRMKLKKKYIYLPKVKMKDGVNVK